MEGISQYVVASYVDDLCKGLRLAVCRGISYLLIGDTRYPLIDSEHLPPEIEIFAKDGHLTFYAFWRESGIEHEAYIKVATTRLHISKGILIAEPHGAFERFRALVIIRLFGDERLFSTLRETIEDEKWRVRKEEGEAVSTYLEEFFKGEGM
ncbi:hypothetical protein [Pyrococcus yayanosii]|uniref:Uncharacterized protein n=1 Tax=Pyrococcus yayanosii (strain CH1 / JCM 16557) TaxID=529709 RepID=F8AHM2_PYRYC|nr:hypothetical protein [Pyrococcus yayanosii]AEH25394.1 hypothetical protein PYCH_17350 [Pyrococcus yayanosii CH1]